MEALLLMVDCIVFLMLLLWILRRENPRTAKAVMQTAAMKLFSYRTSQAVPRKLRPQQTEPSPPAKPRRAGTPRSV
jgi:uncharacterized membrane protein YbaN (DUF454 family)